MKFKIISILLLLLTTEGLKISMIKPYVVEGKGGTVGKGAFGKVSSTKISLIEEFSLINENHEEVTFKAQFAIKQRRTYTNRFNEFWKSLFRQKSILNKQIKSEKEQIKSEKEQIKSEKEQKKTKSQKAIEEFSKELNAFQAIGAVVPKCEKQIIFKENDFKFTHQNEFVKEKLYKQIKSNELQLLDYFEGDEKNPSKMLFYKYHMDAGNYAYNISEIKKLKQKNKNIGEIMVKIAEVIKKFHEKGCMHGDFKLDNLLVYIESYKGITILKSETELLPYFFVLSDFSSVKCNLKKVCEKPFTKAIYEVEKTKYAGRRVSIHYAPEWYAKIITTKRDVWGVGVFLLSLVSIMDQIPQPKIEYSKNGIPLFVKKNINKLKDKQDNESIKIKKLLTYVWNEMLEVDYTKRTDIANALECIKLILSDTVYKKKTCKIGKDLKRYDFFWVEKK